MTPRDKIVQTVISNRQPAWHKSVFAKIVFRISTRVTAYLGVTELIAFCDAMSILFVSYIDKFTHYFDLNRRFDS